MHQNQHKFISTLTEKNKCFNDSVGTTLAVVYAFKPMRLSERIVVWRPVGLSCAVVVQCGCSVRTTARVVPTAL
jgi:hypothetical protein